MPIPVEEYPTSVYEPNCDYVDGQVLKRNWGEVDHARAPARVTKRCACVRCGLAPPQESRVQRTEVKPIR